MTKQLMIKTLILVFAAKSAFAGMPVFDYAGWVAKAESIRQQILQIRILKDQITRELNAANRLVDTIKNLNINSYDDIRRKISMFRTKARSIGYTYDRIRKEMEKVYGAKGDFKKRYQSWQKQTDESIKDAMVSHGVLLNSKQNIDDINAILKSNRLARAEKANLQALAEINAIQSRQLDLLTEIIATDSRAKQSALMEERAHKQSLLENERRMWKDFDKHEESHPLSSFPKLETSR